MTLVEVLTALLLPGVAVGMKRGFFSRDAGIAWILTLLGHFPGVVYALGNVTKD